MKRIGIITHYYKTINFGGALQAYALSQMLNTKNFKAEQISYVFRGTIQKLNETLFDRIRRNGIIGSIRIITTSVFSHISIKKLLVEKDQKKHNVVERRRQAFAHFTEQIIPHSEKAYTKETISECVNDYEVFITGSDQVWNVQWYHKSFFLDFVPPEKTKISYAASIARNSLTEKQQEIFRNSLKDYKAVSLREKSGVPLIEKLSPVQPIAVLDPTLLLSKGDWDDICAERVVPQKYVFCYFLGDNKAERTIVQKFAKQKGLEIVTISYASGNSASFNRKFGDIKLYDTPPEQFISLIKHAEYVFTDSFHAVVFSFIYQKQYFVFNRDKKASMSSRIRDITELFGTTERFCDGKERENLKYVLSLNDIDYSEENTEFEKLKAKSIDFLNRNLEQE